MIQEYKKHLSMLEDEIEVLTKSIEECSIIQSIPGIRKKSLQRLFLIPGKLIDLIIQKNL